MFLRSAGEKTLVIIHFNLSLQMIKLSKDNKGQVMDPSLLTTVDVAV